MTIYRQVFPNRLLALPNLQYCFDVDGGADHPMRIVRSFDYAQIGRVYVLAIGAIGVEFFQSGTLASFDKLDMRGSGVVPDEVADNHDALIDLQLRRQTFVNFIAAALFGRISANTHRALTGAEYFTLDRVFFFSVSGDEVLPERHAALDSWIAAKLPQLRGSANTYRVAQTLLDDAISFIEELRQREATFEHIDLQACMVMNYQAAILHAQQHTAASLALNISVMETLVWEIFFSFGLVGERTAKRFCTKAHSVNHVSNGDFRAMTLNHRLAALAAGNLIDQYLYRRAEDARLLRNQLMHRGVRVTPKASGNCITAIRDIWALLVEPPFELNAGWSYRI